MALAPLNFGFPTAAVASVACRTWRTRSFEHRLALRNRPAFFKASVFSSPIDIDRAVPELDSLSI